MNDTHHVTWPDGNSVLCYCHIGRDHTVYRSVTAPAVDREALAELRAAIEAQADRWEIEGERLVQVNRDRKSPAAEKRAHEGYTLCRLASELRALLADDGAALREDDEKLRERIAQAVDELANNCERKVGQHEGEPAERWEQRASAHRTDAHLIRNWDQYAPTGSDAE